MRYRGGDPGSCLDPPVCAANSGERCRDSSAESFGPGLLLAFEGVDGAGKATQAARLRDALQAAGRPVELVSFPDYFSASGALIRGHLKGDWWTRDGRLRSGQKHPRPSDRETLLRQSLMLANMLERATLLRRLLREGSDVVLDRWWASAVAYGAAEGLDPSPLVDAGAGLPSPDAWILLDGDPDTFAHRRPIPRDLNEGDAAKLGRARASYLALFSPQGLRLPSGSVSVHPVAVLDGTLSPDRVASGVVEGLRALLGKRFPDISGSSL